MSSTATISPERQAANARNARKSTGPRTEDGKARSSRNALKHGLTAHDVALPNESPEAFQESLQSWLDHDRPRDPVHRAMIERAVTAKWKLERCTRLETARLSEKVRHAVDQYDLDRNAEAEAIGRRLIDDPINRCETPQIHDPDFRARVDRRIADNPAILSRQLQMTSQGVDWLLRRWNELGEMLARHGFWHYPEKFRALWLLGRRPEDVIEDSLVQKVFLACNVAHPEVSDDDPGRMDLQDECYQARMGLYGHPMYVVQVDTLRPRRPADVQTARGELQAIVTNEIDRLNALKAHHLDTLDHLDRSSAERRAMFDDSKEGVLLRRYESACEREFHKAVADLLKLRKEAVPDADISPETTGQKAPIPNEPIAEPDAGQSLTTKEHGTTKSRPRVKQESHVNSFECSAANVKPPPHAAVTG